MKIKKDDAKKKSICGECMRLFGANVSNLLLDLQNIFRDLFLKKKQYCQDFNFQSSAQFTKHLSSFETDF